MGTEAQKLITVSLEKIAYCRRRRREMSLHKNLLVTTVIHKARLAIMEETYYMMSTYGSVDNGIHHRGDEYHLQQQQQQPPPSPPALQEQQQQASYYASTITNEVPVECGGVPAAVAVVQDYVPYDAAPLTPAPAILASDTDEMEDDGRGYLPSHPHHYDLDQDVDHQPRPPDVPPTDAAPPVPPIITGPALSAALASTTMHHQQLTTLTDCSGPVDWEGEHAMAVALRCSGDHGLCVRLEQVEMDDDDDKENLSPVETYSLSCCETNSSTTMCLLNKFSTRTDPCGGATTTVTTNSAGSAFVSTTTTVAPRNGCGQKRPRGGVDDDEAAKRCKWDSANTLCAELVVDCRGADDSDDTSHALRLVSVLSASLGSGISTPAPTSGSGATSNGSSAGACAGRLVRSNSTDLCSKQAKDNTMELVGRSPVLAIAV